MVTIQEIVEIRIKQSPFLEKMIMDELINISAFARTLIPEIEKRLMKPISESAVIMATKRLSDKIKENKSEINLKHTRINDITVKSNISEFTFRNSETLVNNEFKLLSKIKEYNKFITFTQGILETTLILDSELEKFVQDIFVHEKLIKYINGLAVITLKLPKNSLLTPGIYYNILKQLTWYNINITEVVSTLNEFSLILNNKQIDKAFTILKNYFWSE